MKGVITPKCKFCGETMCSLGRTENFRQCCLSCKAQRDGYDNWYTWDEWEVRINCGCCLLRGTETCDDCKKFDKWKYADMGDTPLVAEDWWPPRMSRKRVDEIIAKAEKDFQTQPVVTIIDSLGGESK